MERRGSNTVLVAVLAIAVGFLAAWLIFKNDDSDNSSATVSATTATTGTATTATTGTATTPTTSTSTTTATATGTAPANPQPTVPSCIALWNQSNNRGNQTFLVNLASREPIRVHVGATSNVPQECLITVTANNGDAYVFPEGGGSTYPYAQIPARSDASSLPAAQKTTNALNESDGTLKAR